MRFSGLLQTGVVIMYVLLIMTKALSVGNNSNKPGQQRRSNRNINSDMEDIRSTIIPQQGFRLKMKDGHYLRPTAFAILRRIKNQLCLARQQIKLQIPVIQKFYATVKSALKGNGYNYDWLPREHLFWYERKIRHLDKRKKLKILIPNLYESLRNFSYTFDEMMTFGSSQYVAQYSVYEKRKEILEEISDQLNQVICEVESAVYVFRLRNERNFSNRSLTSVITDMSWNKNPDHTTIMIQDWGVITLYYKFLKDWLQILSKNFISEYRKSSIDRVFKHHLSTPPAYGSIT